MDMLRALLSHAPGDFPWEDVLPEHLANAVYRLAHWIESGNWWGWLQIAIILVAVVILSEYLERTKPQ